MKKLLYLLACLLFFSGVFAQIPNSDFENWDNQLHPVSWETNSNAFSTPPFDAYIVKRDSDSYTGFLAADLYGNGVFKGYAKTTFAVQVHPNHLSLYYKLLFAPCVNDSAYLQQDTASVLVELLHNGVVVDSGYWESKASNLTYSQLIIPISQNAAQFDSCRITLWGGIVRGGCGFAAASTEFKVDHLELKYSSQNGCIDSSIVCISCLCPQVVDPVCGCNGVSYVNYCYANKAGVTSWTAGNCTSTGIEHQPAERDNNEVHVYPVPSRDKLTVTYSLDQSGYTRFLVINMLGQTIKKYSWGFEASGPHSSAIDLKDIAAGVYLLEVRNERESRLVRFIME